MKKKDRYGGNSRKLDAETAHCHIQNACFFLQNPLTSRFVHYLGVNLFIQTGPKHLTLFGATQFAFPQHVNFDPMGSFVGREIILFSHFAAKKSVAVYSFWG